MTAKYFDVPKITDQMRDDYNLLISGAMLKRSERKVANKTNFEISVDKIREMEKLTIVDDRIRGQKVGGSIIDD